MVDMMFVGFEVDFFVVFNNSSNDDVLMLDVDSLIKVDFE